ncbi:MAG: glycosyltransferase family 2 protein [Alphaproteobacteria bacterium]
MSKAPTITVIIPVYNSADTIVATLESVLAQNYQDFEILIVDDCSTDYLKSALSTIESDKITLIQHKQNKGAAAARNTGIQAARGQYIALLDSDDVWMSDKLKKQLAYMRAQASNNVLASCTSFTLRRLIKSRKVDRILKSSEDWTHNLLDQCNVSPGSTLMAERRIFDADEVGLYDPELRRLEDWDWLLRYITRYELGIIEEVLSEIRLSGYPNYSTVSQSADILKAKRIDDIHTYFGKIGTRKVLAGLEVEKGTAAYRQKKYIMALHHFIATGFLSFERIYKLIKRVKTKLITGDHSAKPFAVRHNS